MAFNVSLEVARFIHHKMLQRGVESLDFNEFMFYNLDRVRLDEKLRNYLIIRILDSVIGSQPQNHFRLQEEERLLEKLADYQGGKFDHKLRVILRNCKEDSEVTQSGQISVTTVPQAVWPIEFANPLKHQVIPPQLSNLTQAFSAVYCAKFKQRKLIFLGTFGSAELLLDKKHLIKVGTT